MKISSFSFLGLPLKRPGFVGRLFCRYGVAVVNGPIEYEKRGGIIMKRITVFLVLSLLTSILIGCGSGGGGSREVTISISPKNVTLLQWQEETFTAIVTGLSDPRVTWSATGGDIDENGRYWATEVGTFEVIATSKADPSKSAKTKVYVLAPRAEDFYEIKAWQGYVTWKVNDSWSSTDEAGVTYAHQFREDIKREYCLEEKGYYNWWRRSDSPIEVSGSIHDRSDELPDRKNYGEIKWNGSLMVVPESLSNTDRLLIDEEAGTYSIVLYSFGVPEIKRILYQDDEPWESWESGLPEIRIIDQRLPAVGTTLSGSMVQKDYLYPLWFATGAGEPKETDVTITWHFVPKEK